MPFASVSGSSQSPVGVGVGVGEQDVTFLVAVPDMVVTARHGYVMLVYLRFGAGVNTYEAEAEPLRHQRTSVALGVEGRCSRFLEKRAVDVIRWDIVHGNRAIGACSRRRRWRSVHNSVKCKNAASLSARFTALAVRLTLVPRALRAQA